jgi:hypothetical protein
MTDSDQISKVTSRTADSLRVTLAGPSSEMKVVFLEDLEFATNTVGELRELTDLPHPVDVFMPYRLRPDSAVVIGRHH